MNELEYEMAHRAAAMSSTLQDVGQKISSQGTTARGALGFHQLFAADLEGQKVMSKRNWAEKRLAI